MVVKKSACGWNVLGVREIDMIDKKIGSHCTGCTACKYVCPRSVISMEADNEGFSYPVVDYAQCIQCGKCIKVCPVLSEGKINLYNNPVVYSAWNLDQKVRIDSTSGGIFSALAETFLKHGGVVVGAEYGDDFEIRHVIINEERDIVRLRQSKYAQSNLDNIFRRIKDILRTGKKVLFCGTPCQSSGLQNYLGNQYENLYCCDFICRGVISPKVYRKFLKDMAEINGTSVVKVHFKNKTYGWNRFSTHLLFANGNMYQKDRYDDYYMRGYLKHNLYLRPSCHECHFKKIPRLSDISLGDFWGIGNYKKELDNDMGTSVLLVNSNKGRELLSWMSDKLYIEQRELKEVLKGNHCLMNSAEIGEFRSYFFKHLEHMPFDKLIEKIDRRALHLSIGERMLEFMHNVKIFILKYAGK